ADSTDEEILKELGIKNIDHVIVAIGDDIQASILTTVILDDMGIEKITVKAQSDYHEKILNKIGADHVVHPERDMGKRLAHSLISSNILDYLELSDDYSMVEVRSGKAMLGKTLIDLDMRAKFGCNVVAIRHGKEMKVSPSADYQITEDDVLIVIGADKDISKFERHYVMDNENKCTYKKNRGGISSPVFYTSMIIGKIIGRRFVFSYRSGAIVSMISFLISDHLLVRRSMILFKWFATRSWASLISPSDSRI